MTVSTELSQVLRTWTGVETTFSTGIPAQSAAHVEVTAFSPSGVITPLTINVNFGSSLGGSLPEIIITPIALPPAPQTLLIQRRTPAVQNADFSSTASFDGQIIEDLFDASALRDAEFLGQVTDLETRAIVQPVGATSLDGRGLELTNLAEGQSASSAATVGQIQGLVSGAGNVPLPLLAQVGQYLKATATGVFNWASDKLLRVDAGQGLTAAERETGRKNLSLNGQPLSVTLSSGPWAVSPNTDTFVLSAGAGTPIGGCAAITTLSGLDVGRVIKVRMSPESANGRAVGFLLGSVSFPAALRSNLFSSFPNDVLTSRSPNDVFEFEATSATAMRLRNVYYNDGRPPAFPANCQFATLYPVPLTGTYTRDATGLVTVTMTNHGMLSGTLAQLDFTSGLQTDGAFVVTVTGANTFTVQEPVDFSVTSGAVTRTHAGLVRGFDFPYTRNAAGDYTLTYSTYAAFDKSILAPVTVTAQKNGAGVPVIGFPVSASRSLTSVRVQIANAATGALEEPLQANIIVSH